MAGGNVILVTRECLYGFLITVSKMKNAGTAALTGQSVMIGYTKGKALSNALKTGR